MRKIKHNKQQLKALIAFLTRIQILNENLASNEQQELDLEQQVERLVTDIEAHRARKVHHEVEKLNGSITSATVL